MTLFAILIGARWIHFAALFVLFGSSIFWLSLGRGASTELPRAFHASNALLRIAAFLAFASGVVWIGAIIVNVAGTLSDATDPDTLYAFFFETPFGPAVIVRLILLILIIAPWPKRLRVTFWALLSGGLLIDQAWLGHAAAGGAPMLATYAAHVLAAGIWVGGLPALLFSLVLRDKPPVKSTNEAAIMARYSTLATGAVVLILASGIVNVLYRCNGSIAQLPETNYGQILLFKLICVALMLALGAYNRFVALPKLRGTRRDGLSRGLSISIGTEIVLGLFVLAAAAALGVTSPPS